MSIQDDFKPYVDGNGLLAPNVVPSGTKRGSDNGPMFTSEYFITLFYNLEPMVGKNSYQNLIALCIGEDKELHRAPGDSSPDEVDDYYAAYSAHVTLEIVPQFKLPVRLWRQPQLLYASLCARKDPFRILSYPLAVFTAIIIATSCMFTPVSNTDARRLSWHLIEATKHYSQLCYWASKLWFKRLHKDYGPSGMKAVAGIYYEPKGLNNNPYSKYWKE